MALLTVRIARRDTPVTAEQQARLIAGVTDVVQFVARQAAREHHRDHGRARPGQLGRGRPDGDPGPRRQSAAAQRRPSRPPE